MNKIIILLLAFLAMGSPFGAKRLPDSTFKLQDKNAREGDVIFQSSSSGLSKAIQLATKSKYSHCGIIFKRNGALYVFEAVQPVSATPLAQWIAGGDGGKYVIKRLADAEKILTPQTLNKMKQIGQSFMGKNYDSTFEWTDENVYCSELVWKIYQRGSGIEIGKLKNLREFDLSSNAVKTKLKEHYGNNIPLNEPVISPTAIFDSPLLITVNSN